MVIDTSALIAMVRDEPGAAAVRYALAETGDRLIGAPTWLETRMVLQSSRIGFTADRVTVALDGWELQLIAFGEEHARVAADAWSRYGKGHHPAGLNFGDCMTYATARVAGAALLFVGDDFSRTDIESVL